MMGPFMICPAYYVQSGQLPFSVLWLSLPVGFIVTGLIQANDIHDLAHDKASGIRTMAVSIGRQKAIIVLCLEYISAYLVVFIGVALGFLPLPALLPLLALPDLLRTIRGLASETRREAAVAGLIYWAAGYHAKFGVLLIAGLVVEVVFWN